MKAPPVANCGLFLLVRSNLAENMAGVVSLVIASQLLVVSQVHGAAAPVDAEWLFTAVVDGSLYGYDKANNESFKSGEVPAGVEARREDGMNTLYVDGGSEINLGDFKGTWITNISLCKNATISFLLKTDFDLPKDGKVKLLDAGQPETTNYGLMFEVTRKDRSQDPRVSGEVGDGHVLKEAYFVPANSTWLHVALYTYSRENGSLNADLFVNGERLLENYFVYSRWKLYSGSFPTAFILGSKENRQGFYIANLQLAGRGTDRNKTAEFYRESLKQAKANFSVTIEFDLASVRVRSNDGVAKIPVKRSGDLQIPAIVGYYTSDQVSDYYRPVSDGKLVFAPGEAYKQIEITIVRNSVGQLEDNTLSFSVALKKVASHGAVQVQLGGPTNASVIVEYSPGGTAGGQTVEISLLLSLAFAAIRLLV